MLHEDMCICGECVRDRNITSICKHRRPESICAECLDFAYPRTITRTYRSDESNEAEQSTFNKPPHKNLTWVYLREYAEEVVVHCDPNASVPVTQYNSGVHVTPEQDHLPEACYLLRKEATKTKVHGEPKLATLHVCTEHVVIVDWTAY